MDVRFPSAASFMGCTVGAAVTAFISESDGDAVISFFDGHGLPISRSDERKLESVFASGRRYAPSEDTGILHRISGCETIYTASAVKLAATKDMEKSVKICVIAHSTADSVLKTALIDTGCELIDDQSGTTVFETENGGGALNARNENGGFVNWEQIICIIARDELENGGQVAVPFTAPQAIDRLSENQEWRILRVGGDEDAEKVYHNSPWQWDGVFAAVKLAAIMGKTGKSLAELTESVPDFAVTSREVKISGTRGEVMRRLSEMTEFGRDDGPGLWLGGELGFARVRPASDGEALSITAECATMEAAEELCGKVRDMIEGKE
jgi:mannose-1-phosphate guanylyltransferase/phosphomannomutase